MPHINVYYSHMTVTWFHLGVDAVVRQESLSNFLDGSSGDEGGEGEEEEEEADLFIDEQLLQKDFIANKYSLANLYYSKVGGADDVTCSSNVVGELDHVMIVCLMASIQFVLTRLL